MGDHLTAQFLGAPLDVDQMLRDLPVLGLDVSACRLALEELKKRRDQAEKDLRYWQERVAEVGSLKRRITALRRWLADHASTIDGWPQKALNIDTDTRHRFETKQRKAVRRRG